MTEVKTAGNFVGLSDEAAMCLWEGLLSIPPERVKELLAMPDMGGLPYLDPPKKTPKPKTKSKTSKKKPTTKKRKG